MRGTLLVGLAVVLLVIGVLVIKNMGADDSNGIQKTETKAYIDKAQSAADGVNKRLTGIGKQAQETE